jgi:hypothetical protein
VHETDQLSAVALGPFQVPSIAERMCASADAPIGYREYEMPVTGESRSLNAAELLSGLAWPGTQVGLLGRVVHRPVPGVPVLSEARRAEVPVRADFACCLAQITTQVVNGRATPVPVAVVDSVDDEARLEHERVRDRRVVVRVGVFLDVEFPLNYAVGIGEERSTEPPRRCGSR